MKPNIANDDAPRASLISILFKALIALLLAGMIAVAMHIQWAFTSQAYAGERGWRDEAQRTALPSTDDPALGDYAADLFCIGATALAGGLLIRSTPDCDR